MQTFIFGVTDLFIHTLDAAFGLAYFWLLAGLVLFVVALTVISMIVRGCGRM